MIPAVTLTARFSWLSLIRPVGGSGFALRWWISFRRCDDSLWISPRFAGAPVHIADNTTAFTAYAHIRHLPT